jgi:hypothetical protein
MITIKETRGLIGYCGAYCGECGILKGRIIAIVARDLKELIESYHYPDWLPKFGGIDFNFEEFQKGLDYFTREKSGCYTQVPCKEGCGVPGCKMKECAKKKEIEYCFECGEFPCPTAKEHCLQFGEESYHAMIIEHEEFRKLGIDAWTKAHQQRAEKGYCSSTRKYYTKAKSESVESDH